MAFPTRRDAPSNMSLIAAQISSLSTLTTPSRSCRQTRKGSSPTMRTAVPSLNGPTSGSVMRSPFSKLRAIASPSIVSTPMTRVRGLPMRLTYSHIPATRPPPPTAAKTASR